MARQAPLLIAGTYDFAFCHSREDWYAVQLGEEQGLIVELAYSVLDASLMLELLPATGEEWLATGYRRENGELLTYQALDAGRYLLRVSQNAGPEERLQLYYRMRLRLVDERVCQSDPGCAAAGEVCDPATHLCVPRDCRRGTLPCEPDQLCNEQTGQCDQAGGCIDDGLENGSFETAYTLEPGRRYANLTICEGEHDWFQASIGSGKCLHLLATFLPSADAAYNINLRMYGPGGLANELLYIDTPIGDRDAIYWNSSQEGVYTFEVLDCIRNTYSIQLEVTDGNCSMPCTGPHDCVLYQMDCDMNAGHCVPQ
ncbi:MAG: hypothetical protein FJ125_08650 [Deltaproteobacteria bacterium]|nr:hypothetical protein [Deltaproteobacteria bacterium]